MVKNKWAVLRIKKKKFHDESEILVIFVNFSNKTYHLNVLYTDICKTFQEHQAMALK